MANITKNQARARAKEQRELLKTLADQLIERAQDLHDLAEEMREESDYIEPYEGKEELTPQQEERQEWLNEQADNIESQAEELENKAEEITREEYEEKREEIEEELNDLYLIDLTEYSEQEQAKISDKIKELESEIEDFETCQNEVFQWFIVSDNAIDLLREANELVFYSEKLDCYVWGVTHWGTSWDYVLTSIKLQERED